MRLLSCRYVDEGRSERPRKVIKLKVDVGMEKKDLEDLSDYILPGGGNIPPPLYGIPNIPYPRAQVVPGPVTDGVVIFTGPFREYTRLVIDNQDVNVDIWLCGEGRELLESIPIRAFSARTLDFATPTNDDGTIKERLSFEFHKYGVGDDGTNTVLWIE